MVRRAAWLVLCLAPLLAFAGDERQKQPDEDPAQTSKNDSTKAILERSRAIMANPESVLGEGEGARYQAQARHAADAYKDDISVIEQASKTAVAKAPAVVESIAPGTDALARTLMQAEARADGPAAAPVRYRIFVSQSMPDAEVRSLAQLTLELPGAVLVVRGLKPGQTFGDLLHWMLSLMGPLEEGTPVPIITIDPTPFTALGIEQAPAMARYDMTGTLEAWVFGVTSPAWLDGKIAAGRTGALGVHGPTVAVIEENMITLMKQAASAYDWVAERDRAIARFFSDNVPRQALPTARVHRIRRIDPTFIVQDTMALPDGRVVYRKGDRINPLAQLSFNQIVVAFNPQDPQQIEVVREVVRLNPDRLVTVVATDLSGVGDFKGFGQLMDRVGTRIYMLPDALVSQFHLQAVPSVVTADGLEFVVEEVPPGLIKEMEHVEPDAPRG